jgi:alginate O-acetyltransferase complex protein AlgI
MLFTSATFLLLFLPILVLVYWLLPRAARVWFILVASYVFYLAWNPWYGFLLAASTVVNFTIARRLPAVAHPKRLLAAGVAFNLAVLGFFKYIGLFSNTAADLLGALGVLRADGFDGFQVLLPLAISFFTFEMISVLIDVYRGDARVGPFIEFAAYKAYFPKLLSGPITRYVELGPQLHNPPDPSFDRMQSGLALFALGLAKKLAIANNLALLVTPVFADPKSATSGAAMVAILAFGFQIYFDFSAYTDMARGISRMLGLELPFNFRLPYSATSPSDFWRRWHMSLSRWLRDYLYIPLGGNRKGRERTYANLMLTMMLGGLWHGAGWRFAIWGGLHGLFLAVNHLLRGRIRAPGTFKRAAGWVVTMAAVFFAWVFFRADGVGQAFDVLRALGRGPLGLGAGTAIYSSLTLKMALAALLALLGAHFVLAVYRERIEAAALAAVARLQAARPVALAAATVAAWTFATLLAPSSNVPFIYFRF